MSPDQPEPELANLNTTDNSSGDDAADCWAPVGQWRLGTKFSFPFKGYANLALLFHQPLVNYHIFILSKVSETFKRMT